MAPADRVDVIKQLEAARGSRVVCLLTGDRAPSYGTIIAGDAPPLLYQHLERIGRVEQIDLFLYSRGGHTLSGFRIPGLVREYCKRFSVLVPYRAHSAATLIALGADEIVMTPLAELSPVDPSTNGPFNPPVPVQVAPGEAAPTYPVSVEDVAGYLNLARELAHLRDTESLRPVFEQLTKDVRPLALGGVYRARSQMRMLIRKLLTAHRSPPHWWVIRSIVKALSEELLSHDYLISREEAIRMRLSVKPASPEEERLMMTLYRHYETAMELEQPFNIEAVLPGPGSRTLTLDRAFIESSYGAHIFRTIKEFSRALAGAAGVQAPQQLQTVERVLREGWELTNVQP